VVRGDSHSVFAVADVLIRLLPSLARELLDDIR